MPGLNQQGPENMGPRTGRRMGICEGLRSRNTDDQNKGLGLDRCLGMGRGLKNSGCRLGRGYGRMLRTRSVSRDTSR